MKILQINCVYGTGSTGRLTQAIHTRLLAEGVKSVVCCGRGPRSTDPHVHKVCGELYAKAQHAEADLTGLRRLRALDRTLAAYSSAGGAGYRPPSVHQRLFRQYFPSCPLAETAPHSNAADAPRRVPLYRQLRYCGRLRKVAHGVRPLPAAAGADRLPAV